MAKQLFERVEQWEGRTILDRNGEKVGKVQDVYFDVDTNRPEWALVRTGLFGTRDNIVPIIGASRTGDDIRIPFDKEQVKHAPYVDAEDDLSQADEATLAR